MIFMSTLATGKVLFGRAHPIYPLLPPYSAGKQPVPRYTLPNSFREFQLSYIPLTHVSCDGTWRTGAISNGPSAACSLVIAQDQWSIVYENPPPIVLYAAVSLRKVRRRKRKCRGNSPPTLRREIKDHRYHGVFWGLSKDHRHHSVFWILYEDH
jgi:hypothetical protein